jgi:hypothetical protein
VVLESTEGDAEASVIEQLKNQVKLVEEEKKTIVRKLFEQYRSDIYHVKKERDTIAKERDILLSEVDKVRS